MRRRSLATLGACTSASAAFCALLTTGVVGTSLAVLVAPPLSPPATATGLRSFAGCEELRQWYVDTALPYVGPWGLGWPGYLTDGLVARTALSSPAVATPVAASAVDGAVPGGAVGNGDTGTNLQEAGVDEPDVAKTDGSVVVHVDGRRLVVTDVTGERPRELSRTRLPGRLADAELLLVDDTVLVLGSDGYPGYPAYRDVMPAPGMVDSGQLRGPHSRLLAFDIGDPSDPVVTEQQRFDGALVTAREYDGTVRVVVSTGAPALDFVHPTRHRTPRQARQENRRIVRETTIDDWLPHVDDGSGRERLVDCDQVRHPEEPSGLGTITVLSFDADAPAERSSTAVTTGGDLVYSSTDRLYVGTIRGGWGDPVPVTGRRDSGRAAPPAPGVQVHAFALEGDRTRYVASGEVPGTVRDRWSFSEYDGHLRVATALGNRSWDPRENAVVVLEERGTELVEVGRVGDLGPGEQIQSVRWFGALAVVVTFRQTDPLYTLDLSAPADPRLLGTLKIPGFSSYLHPVGDGLLLGLGQDATRTGRTRGAQAAVFDLSDLRHPRRTDTVAFARHTELAAAWDSRAFTYLPEQRVAVTTVQDVWNGRTRLAVLRVGSDGSLGATTTERLDRWSGPVRALPVGDRVALVSGGEVRLISV